MCACVREKERESEEMFITSHTQPTQTSEILKNIKNYLETYTGRWKSTNPAADKVLQQRQQAG